MQSLILRILAVGCIVFALFSMAMSYRRQHRLGPDVATINGEALTQDEFYTALKLAAGSKVLPELIQQKAILQEARRDNISVKDADIQKKLDDINKQAQDVSARNLLADQVRARYLLRKIVLKDVDEATKHKFYDTFKDDLVQYDLAAIVPSAPEDADAIEKDLQAGHSFEQVADTYPSRLGSMAHGSLGVQSPRAIASVLGDDALKNIAALKPGTFNKKRFLTRGEALFVKVNSVHATYDEVKPEIDDIMGAAGENEVLDRLTTEAKVVSPYIKIDASASPAASDSPTAGSPEASDSPVLDVDTSPAPAASTSASP